ncbi:CHAT domain protein [Microbacterium trichothecenolyticum]|uniref:CHAT domain protein n=2 Tax=Microbacterium trichothecenolyticum TaxID=69370 RepID=A0A0M2HJK0_MICTR|nr:CHAT domain protein [Microbacterium trichothecenolyticum]
MSDLEQVLAVHAELQRVDVGPNERCGQSSCATRPSVLISGEQRRVLLVAPEHRLNEEYLEQLALHYVQRGYFVDRSAAVAPWLTEWRARHIEAFNEYSRLELASESVPSDLFESLTPEFFCAMYALTMVGAPDTKIAVFVPREARSSPAASAETSSLEFALDHLDQLVLNAWLSVADISEYQGEAVPERSLMDRVSSFVVLSAVPPRVLDRWIEVAQRLISNPAISGANRYALGAISAYLCTVTQRELPFRRQWSWAWLQMETMAEAQAPHAESLHLPANLVAASTDPSDVVDCAVYLCRERPHAFPAMAKALVRTGRGYLLESVLSSAAGVDSGQPMEVAREWFRARSPYALGPETQFLLAGVAVSRTVTTDRLPLAFALREELRGALAEWLVNGAISKTDWLTHSMQVDAWVGTISKLYGAPAAFLALVGSEPRPEESSAPLNARFALELERSNALRLLGRIPDALRALERYAEEVEESDGGDVRAEQLALLRLNRAILRRELGDLEGALAALEGLADEMPEAHRAAAHASLAATHLALGDPDRAAEASRRSLLVSKRMARHPLGYVSAATRAQELELSGDMAGALDALEQVQLEELNDVATLTMVCATILNLELQSGGVLGTALGRAAWSEATRRIEDTSEFGDCGAHIRHLLMAVWAMRAQLVLKDWEHERWKRLANLTHEMWGYASPLGLVGVALQSWHRGDEKSMRAALDSVPESLRRTYSATVDVAAVSASTRNLSVLLEHATQEMLGSGVSTDVARVIAELSRDVVGRAVESDAPGGLPWPDQLPRLPKSWGVIEWMASREEVFSMLSREGEDPIQLPFPEGLDDMAYRLAPRLTFWGSDMSGDVFDVEGWSRLREWAEAVVHEFSLAGLVIIEHALLAGIPWQAVFGPLCPTTTIPSWGTLSSAPAWRRPGSIGVVTVPRTGESEDVARSLFEAANALSTLGAKAIDLANERATVDDCLALMASVDLVAMLCHGVRDAESATMTWQISADEALPWTEDLGGAGPGAEFHLGPREIRGLDKAPVVVLSAACSTGVSRYAGLGEQLGLFRALRRQGTAVLIAPRWDVPAPEILSILTEVGRRLLDGEDPIEATRNACIEAARTKPAWIAWALFVQGMPRV